jgi:hypothetical protein
MPLTYHAICPFSDWASPSSPPAVGRASIEARNWKRRPCPAFARCKAGFNLSLAATSLLFFERQSSQVQRPSGFAFASNLTHAKAPTLCAPN